jgi:hypothetical protein
VYDDLDPTARADSPEIEELFTRPGSDEADRGSAHSGDDVEGVQSHVVVPVDDVAPGGLVQHNLAALGINCLPHREIVEVGRSARNPLLEACP